MTEDNVDDDTMMSGPPASAQRACSANFARQNVERFHVIQVIVQRNCDRVGRRRASLTVAGAENRINDVDDVEEISSRMEAVRTCSAFPITPIDSFRRRRRPGSMKSCRSAIKIAETGKQ